MAQGRAIKGLECAIGALLIGRQAGWTALQVIHDLATVDRFERLLGLKLREPALPPDSLIVAKSVPWLKKLGVDAFWWAVMSSAKGA